MKVTGIKTRIPRPRGLTKRPKVLFKDSGGNRLYARLKPDGSTVQYSAKNAQNQLVCESGCRTLMKRWNRQR